MHQDSPRSAAVVGAAGGAGATRLCLELGATLAREGRDVAVLDVAFATEGLARHVEGRIDVDATALLVDPDRPLADALVDHPTVDAPGRLALVPAFAPFERLARAKSPEAVRRLDERIAEALDAVDYVLLDAPPVAANQAIAAVTAADRRLVVLPPGERGVDALQRLRGRFGDVGVGADLVAANRTSRADAPPDADYAIPDCGFDLAATDPDSTAARTLAALAGDLFDVDGLDERPTGSAARLRRLVAGGRSRVRDATRHRR